jgi:putative transposase
MPSGMPNEPERRPASAAVFMSIPARRADPTQVKAGARTFFVTSSAWGKQNLLQSNRAAELFIQVLYDYRAQNKFRLHEFVVMPNHFHLLLTVESEMTIERAMQFIKGGFSFRAGKELGMRSPVWQKGFSEVRISDAEAFRQVRTYIRNNPVARHLVAEPSDYLYSSAHPGFELDPIPHGIGNEQIATRSA